MDPPLDCPFDLLTINEQQQPALLPDMSDLSDMDELDKLLGDFPDLNNATFNNISTDTFLSDDNGQSDIDTMIYIDTDQNILTNSDSQSHGTFTSYEELLQLVGTYTVNQQPQQSTFIEQNDSPDSYSSQAVGSSPVEPKANDISPYVQDFVNEQERLRREAKRNKTRLQSTTVTPIDNYLHSSVCEPCTTQMYSDYTYQQQTLQFDTYAPKKIQIAAQPRSKFRPRTLNESKNSSHYVRCEDGVTPEHPTIYVPQEWNHHADVNFIEVAWVGLDKELHPYTLYNKNASPTLEDHVMVFKQNEPGILYFRLTPDDFLNGFKTFMLELIKSRQDNVITKELIRSRQLEQSMLRFTRIFQLGKGYYQRDEGSVEYSTVMIEAYGEIDVEHMGPRYGPMCGQEMLYMVLKGRILKNDLKIEINEPNCNWTYSVSNFTKNGNVVYFLMPPFPYPQLATTIKANILVSHKNEEISQNIYLYKKSLDEELAELRINDSESSTASSASSNDFDAFDFLTGTDILLNNASRRTSTTTKRTTKRLNNKQK